ncbi:type II secretion system F family protein [Pseudarthrobacter sp. MDT3-28]|uniref:type II secretion system F family protein n=1 Tax=Pseudarthrobacter raffinosi TaxID=2953651 RepID=UPI00208FEB3B|nr:type II secretion system F family protein [Pseudarthrobacter sp. MDT3-28]MCO4236037.1 type II secretion system F family protein [Pseudarthrobacter sp. MDT3-28]
MNTTDPIFFTVGVALCFVSLAILLLSTLGTGKSGIALSRRRPGVIDEPSLLTRAAESAVSFVDRNVSKNARFGTRESLEQAGLRLRQADFILLVCCVGVTTGVVGFILGGIFIGLLFVVLTPFSAMLFLRIMTNRRRAKFDAQLGDTIQMLAGGLRAGHSLLRSVDAVSQEADLPTSEEFARLVNETRLGRDLRDSMLDAARRLKSEDFDWIGQAIEIHREVGGNLAEVLDQVGETIRERSEIKGQVKSLSAEGKLSAYILVALPVGIFLYLSIANPVYTGSFYTSVLGWIMMGFSVILLALGSFWLSRVVKIKF